jgi:hypothetical protein
MQLKRIFILTGTNLTVCIIFFGQATDLFGGGTHKKPNGKLIIAAVFDIQSGFDLACQEVGHALGLRHELGAWYYDANGKYTNEYGCPYSVMSASRDFSFTRAPNPSLPGNSQTTIGPYIPTAHLYINQYHAVNPNGVFNHPDSVTYVPATYEHTQVNVKLFARDEAIESWPNRKTVLAVLPPIVPGGDTHFLELRRKNSEYDGGIGNASIIILAGNFFAGNGAVQDPSAIRLRYVDRIDLEGFQGDLDYHSFSGRFVVRVISSAPGFASVNLAIGGGNAWQNFRINLDNIYTSLALASSSDWNSVLIAPCPLEAKREFKFRTNTFQTFIILQAHSAGYETPHYLWKINGSPLKSAADILKLQVMCRHVVGTQLSAPALHDIQCTFLIKSGRLELDVVGPYADIVLGIEVIVGESSPSVMKNFYPERSLSTNLRVDNLNIEWEDDFQAASQACWERLRKSYNQLPEMIIPHRGIGDPDPPYFKNIDVGDLIRVLVKQDPRAAYAVAIIVAEKSGVSIDQVMQASLKTPSA